ncbi:signal recognition particle, SRP9/SRP14 subunit [Vararia minispora EC-137]|uniref:Signal recognition particle, SRP9/SRP14 subunit n=1 Tax=Vararia minispora EC-137 TaxID=1314806 RepID=A0ACB8Q7D3_9AGAM|nr:signal recognition particle, SRP9/SRP14 subunit [Vararia minispora EC-137]
MQLVDNDTFLKQLSTLFESSKGHGTIWLTHKRLTYDGADALMADSSSGTHEYPCLIRAVNGKEVKFSTHVQPQDVDKFHIAYGALLKGSFTTLRKRDKKREKLRAEEAAARKRKLADAVLVDGPKRGAGRRKRQRKAKAAARQEETRKRMQEKEEKAAKMSRA